MNTDKRDAAIAKSVAESQYLDLCRMAGLVQMAKERVKEILSL